MLAVVMLPRLLNLDIFIGPDEKAIWGWGNRFALALSQGDWRNMLIGDGYPAVTVMWAHTIGITLKWLWLQLISQRVPFEGVIGLDRPPELYAERRLFLALGNGLQILAAYPLLRLVWNRQVAVVVIVLMALEPLALAFTRMIRADALLSGFMFLSILATLTFLKTGNPRYNWLAGAIGGLAALSKSNGGVTALVAIVIYLVVAWRRSQQISWQSSLRWLGMAIFGWGAAAAIVYFGLWPAWWTQPVDTFNLVWGKVIFHAVEAAAERSTIYFWGTIHPHGPGPWFYPALAALRLTPWLLLGGLVAVGRCLWWGLRPRRTAFDFNEGVILFYIAIYWLIITIPGQKADRHFLPIIPGLAVLMAIESANGLRWVGRMVGGGQFASFVTPRALYFTRLAILLLIVAAIAHISRSHPLYSTYFNPLSGNPQFWQWALPIGNGEGVDEALRYLSALPGATESTLVCGTNLPRCEPFFPGQLQPQEDLRSGQWFKANYVLWHIDEQQLELFPAGVLAYLRRQPQIYVARHNGLEYTWLYALPQPPFVTLSKLEGVATLYGYDTAQSLTTLAPGDRLRLHLYWQNEGQAHQQQFWWRIADSHGYVWTEALAQPLPEFVADAPQTDAVVEGEVTLNLPPDMPPGPYTLHAGFANAKGDVGQFTLPDEDRTLQVVGSPAGATEPTHTLNQPLAPDLQLRGYDLSEPEAIPGDTVWVTLHWQALGSIQRNYQMSLWLLDRTGQILARWDGQPVYNTFPTSQWPVDSPVRDPRPLSLPENLPPGRYSLMLAWGDAATSLSPSASSLNLDVISLVERKVTFDIPPMQFQANQPFEPVATLLGYDLVGDLAPNSVRVLVTLYWQVHGPAAQPYRVHLRLTNTSGQTLVEQEAELGTGVADVTEWRVGEIVTDPHELAITAVQSPVSANLEMRLLNAAGEPVPLSNGAEALVVSEVQQKVMWRTSSP